MKRTKEELLLECIKQFEHIEEVSKITKLATTASLIREIKGALSQSCVSGSVCCNATIIRSNASGKKFCSKCGDHLIKQTDR